MRVEKKFSHNGRGADANKRLENILKNLDEERHNLLAILISKKDKSIKQVKEDLQVAKDIFLEVGGARWMGNKIKVVEE